MLRLDEFARLIDVELYAVDFARQVVRKLDGGFVDLVDQQDDGFVGRERVSKDTPYRAVPSWGSSRATAAAAFRALRPPLPRGSSCRFPAHL